MSPSRFIVILINIGSLTVKSHTELHPPVFLRLKPIQFPQIQSLIKTTPQDLAYPFAEMASNTHSESEMKKLMRNRALKKYATF
ncbi:hypothetical protein Sjap_015473 [Stephania japonica]|uniref:Uncharacterized protein n=1 Tax=Stephania japonica TaxID=461633 RepID=A0AAP0IJ67_9MAGN